MKYIKIILAIIASALLLSSCKQDETLQYNTVAMGNVIDGTFVSDQGNIYNIVEQNCLGNLAGMKRAILVCDILSRTDNRHDEYDVRVNRMAEVLDKAPITSSEATENVEAMVEDPICIRSIWISGGYINMYLLFELKFNTKQKHLVNLVLDEEASSEGKYVFTLRHNSFGESLIYDAQEITLGGNYVSFPVSSLITEENADILVKSQWYKPTGQAWWSSEIQDYNFTLSYTEGGYEQAPATLESKTATQLN